MKFHPDVLAAHAQFGGDLEDMQRNYDSYDKPTPKLPLSKELVEELSKIINPPLENWAGYVLVFDAMKVDDITYIDNLLLLKKER